MHEVGRCAICGRRVKNKVRDPETGREYFICPRHLKDQSVTEIIENLRASERFFLRVGC